MNSKIISDYLRKRAVKNTWKFLTKPKKSNYRFFIIIPAYNELEDLPNTLDSIKNQNVDLLKNTLVVIIVNNSKNVEANVMINNQKLLEDLRTARFPFEIGLIDASSPNLVLPEKHAGVGLARKIGMDLSLHFAESNSLFCCLDADSPISPDYLQSIDLYFVHDHLSAAVVGFRHQTSNDPDIERFIRIYESFLKTTAEKLWLAGSPYGYTAVGSTIICFAESYAAVGGMPRKKAGEDFYFLQELLKYQGVDTIKTILVYPSPRLSDRVHLGTGVRMKQAEDGLDLNSLFYKESAFDILKDWLNIGSGAFDCYLNEILKKSGEVNDKLPQFLISENIDRIWTGLQKSSPSGLHFSDQFHRWFDSLKTIRLLKNFS